MTKADLEKSEQLFSDGVELYEQEKVSEAEEKFLQALEIQPDSEEIMYNLALVYFEQKKYDLSFALADRIHHLDCTELFDALDEAGFQPHYPIPDDIPEVCSSCEHFRPGSVIRDEGGFCLFYQQHVQTKGTCLVYVLLDEGKISQEEIDQNRNTRRNALIKCYMDSLNEESLPEEMICENCSSVITLSQSERNEKRFTCSNCSFLNDLNSRIESLAETMKSKKESELFTILLQSSDFQLEFMFAARKEIIRRSINLSENKQFLQMIH